MSIVFLPQPKNVKMRNGFLSLLQRPCVGIASSELLFAVALLAEALDVGETVISVKGIKDTITLAIEDGCRQEGYRISIREDGVRMVASSNSGLRHAITTFKQIVRQAHNRKLPCLEIEDWPDLAVRGVYYDVCRGRVPLIERLFELTDRLSDHKINELQLYIEHTFLFRRHPLISAGVDPLTADDIMRLDRHCQARGIELVPSLASFGHMHTILRHKPYHRLAEDFGCNRYNAEVMKENPGVTRGPIAQSLAPANPDSYKFLDELYSEFLPCFSSGKFNVCCDETWDLGMGQSYDLACKIGKGKLYLGHIKQLNEIAKKHGKRIQFWGDIIRHYPELIHEIPKDVTVLDWAYTSTENFDRIKDFTDSKLESYVCPTVSSFVTLFPRVPESCGNIAGWAKAACAHGAKGMLNTDWGDGGHYNFMEYSWIGYLFGAEQSWNHRADRKSFTRRFCKLFMNINDAEFCSALIELGDISHLKVGTLFQSVWQHLFFSTPWNDLYRMRRTDCETSKNGIIRKSIIAFDADLGRQTMLRLERIKKTFSNFAKQKTADPQKLLPYWIFAVDATIHAARKLTVFGHAGNNTAARRMQLKREMQALMTRFEALWMQRNRRSEIAITLKYYEDAISALTSKPNASHSGGSPLEQMQLSKVMPRPESGIASAPCVSARQKLGWRAIEASCAGELYGFLNAHAYCGDQDGMVYYAGKVRTGRDGSAAIALGHDGGAKVFVDGKEVLCVPERINPCAPGRSRFKLDLAKGEHEIIVAFDLDRGRGWGIFLEFMESRT